MDHAGPHAAQLAEHAAAPSRPAALRAAAPPATSGAPAIVVYGYLPYWVDDVTAEQLAGLTHLAIFNVGVGDDGSLSSVDHWTERAPTDVPLAQSVGVKVHVTVTNFDSDSMEVLLGSASARANAVAQLKAQVEAYGADGVNVDFEGLPSSRRDEFVSFIQDLQAAVDEVWLAMPAVDWNGSYDYDQLAAASDGLFIMGYGFHWTGGDPGPNDPLESSDLWGSYSLGWSVDDYRTYGAPDDKIVLGLPLYGQVWPVSDNSVPTSASDDGWSIEMASADAEAAVVGKEYDTEGQSSFYRPSGEQVWYDDTEDVRTRVQWARAQGLAGVGFWALGYESAGFWSMMAVETAPGDDDTGGGDTPGDTGGETGANGDTKIPPARTLDGEEGGGCGCATGRAPLGLLGWMAVGLVRRRRG